jgi:hypothetical protein
MSNSCFLVNYLHLVQFCGQLTLQELCIFNNYEIALFLTWQGAKVILSIRKLASTLISLAVAMLLQSLISKIFIIYLNNLAAIFRFHISKLWQYLVRRQIIEAFSALTMLLICGLWCQLLFSCHYNSLGASHIFLDKSIYFLFLTKGL